MQIIAALIQVYIAHSKMTITYKNAIIGDANYRQTGTVEMEEYETINDLALRIKNNIGGKRFQLFYDGKFSGPDTIHKSLRSEGVNSGSNILIFGGNPPTYDETVLQLETPQHPRPLMNQR